MYKLTVFLAALLLAGCFGDNPTKSAEDPLDAADALFEQGNYAEAMVAYEQAVAQDSTLSLGYYGYINAVLNHYRVQKSDLSLEFAAAISGGWDSIPFLNHADSVLSRRIQALSRVNRMLDRLVHRDTLSLTDGKKSWSDLKTEFAAYKAIYQILRVYDIDQNDTLDARDWTYRDLLNANENPEWLSGGDMDSAIALLVESSAVYRFGDKLDNDGDGCIDEEIIDSLDNDLDGFVDEDARIVNGNGTVGNPGDSVNNDRAGSTDDALENLAGVILAPSRPYLLTFVAMYLSTNGETNLPESQSTWVKIKKGAADMNVRLRIQKDSLSLPSRAVLPTYAAKLDSAKSLIGGCWRNY